MSLMEKLDYDNALELVTDDVEYTNVPVSYTHLTLPTILRV